MTVTILLSNGTIEKNDENCSKNVKIYFEMCHLYRSKVLVVTVINQLLATESERHVD